MDVVETTNNELDTQKPTDSVETESPKTDKFSDEYVKELRTEAKKHRLEKEQLATKLAEFEKAKLEAENNALIEQGRFKELFEKEQAEKQRLIDELERVKPYEQKHLDFINQKKEGLLNSLPEDIRDTFKDLDVDKLEALSSKFINDKGTPQGVPNNNNKSTPEKRVALTVPFQGLV